MDRKKKFWLIGLLLLAAAAGTAYLYTKAYIKWDLPLYAASAAALFFEGAAAFALLSAAGEKPKKKVLLSSLLGGVAAAGGVGALSFIVNVLIFRQGGASQAAIVSAVYGFCFALFCVLRLKKRTGAKFVWKPLAGVALSLCVLLAALCPAAGRWLYESGVLRCAVPTHTGVYTKPESALIGDADLYVSPDGSDENDGSLARPLATIEKARDKVRAMDKSEKSGIIVALKAGEYAVEHLEFSAADSGTQTCPVTYCAYGDGEVILNGGVTLPREALRPVADEAQLARLSAEAQREVLCVSLTDLGITAAQYGALHAIGSYSTAEKYDGDWTGDNNCELFVDDRRQTLARYPNGDGCLYTGEVVSEGLGKESADCAVKEAYFEARNPTPDVYKMDKALSARIAAWQTTEDVWMFGYWRWDWADASTPLGAVDHENRTLSPMFVSYYGAIRGAPYYFYNVFEELDAPGEWYLDRDAGILYLWPPADFSETSVVTLSLSADTIITANALR